MTSTKTKWTQEEEEHLQILMKEYPGNKWLAISKKFNEKFPDSIKNGKQCRDRFVNFIQFKSQGIENEEWGKKNWDIFFEKYYEVGPKWSEIAACLPGNPENRIKNKFYGLIRKILKKLNGTVRILKQKKIKPIKSQSLTRILRYTPDDWISQPDVSLINEQLKKDLMSLCQYQGRNQNIDFIKQLVQRIHQFNLKIRGVIMRNSKTKLKKFSAIQSTNKKMDVSNCSLPSTLNRTVSQSNNDLQVEKQKVSQNMSDLSVLKKKNTFKQQIIVNVATDLLELPKMKKAMSSFISELPKQVSEILQEEYINDCPPYYFSN